MSESEGVFLKRVDMRAIAADAGMKPVAGSFSFNRLFMYALEKAPEFLVYSRDHDERAIDIRVVEHIAGQPKYVPKEIYHLGRSTLSMQVALLAYEQFHPQAPSNAA